LAISEQKKEEILAQYKDWLSQSQAVILVEYTGVTMKDLDSIRAKIREAGGEFHVVKNTLVKLALEASGMKVHEEQLISSTAMGFAFKDAAAVAKTLNDTTKTVQAIKLKGGFLGTQSLDANGIKALAELPPLPVVRGQLLGVLLAPASKLARTLAEPGRQVASVVKAYSEKTAPVAA